jgi:hypothetical protein
MRQIIDRVTCSKCGQVFDFERYNVDTNEARIEAIGSWLTSLGWKLLRYENCKRRAMDFCPLCSIKFSLREMTNINPKSKDKANENQD